MNFIFQDAPHSKTDEIVQLVEANGHKIYQQKSFKIMFLCLEFMQKKLIERITITETLLECKNIEPFLRQLITGKKQWLNTRIKFIVIGRCESASKPELAANKKTLSEYWNWKGTGHYYLLQSGIMVTSELDLSETKWLEFSRRKGVVW